MYGIIIVGHGRYAEGLLSSVDLILGEQDNVEAINFKKDNSSEELRQKIIDVITHMREVDGIIFMADLVGGTPFNVSALLSHEIYNSGVVGGTNLPLLLEVLMNRNNSDMDDIISNGIANSKDSIRKYEKEIVKETDYRDEDGI